MLDFLDRLPEGYPVWLSRLVVRDTLIAESLEVGLSLASEVALREERLEDSAARESRVEEYDLDMASFTES